MKEILNEEYQPPRQTVQYEPELLVIGVDAFSSEFFDKHLHRCSTYDWLFDMLDRNEVVKRTLFSHGRVDNRGNEILDPSEAPPHTGPEWSCMYTGLNPKKHGIEDQGWKTDQLDYADIEKRTIFEQVDKTGYTQGIFSLPVTYPAPQIENGWSISGFPGPINTAECYHPGDIEVVEEVVATPRNLIQVRDELPKPGTAHLHQWWCMMEDDEREEVIDKNMRLELKKKDNALELQSEQGVDVFYYGTHMIDKAGHTEGLDPDGNMTMTSYTTMGYVIRGLVEKMNPRNWILVSDHGFQMNDTNHDHKGILIASLEDEELMENLREGEEELDTRYVATLISRILGIGIGWIGKDRDEELEEGDKEEIKNRLKDMGYL